MRFIISGKNIEVTKALKEAVQEKLRKLDRYFTDETEVNVTFTVEKDRQTIEVTIPMKGHIVRAEQTSSDMYVSIDLVVDIIERQLRKYKNKIIQKKQEGIYFQPEFIEEELEDEEIKIIRSKRFAIKPMDAEEACLQMEMLGHNFYVFNNVETNEVSVVYKRKKANTYGLIEPEF